MRIASTYRYSYEQNMFHVTIIRVLHVGVYSSRVLSEMSSLIVASDLEAPTDRVNIKTQGRMRKIIRQDEKSIDLEYSTGILPYS